MANQAPEKTFRIGRISAAVFKNTIELKDGPSAGQRRVVRSVNVQRSYQDDEGKWEYTTSFQLADLPAAVRVLQLAQQFVESQEVDTTP